MTSSQAVFIGNIAYNATEGQLADMCKIVGRVKEVRFAFDGATGRFRGYGFCTFVDAETAESAVRNLNGTMFLGRRLSVSPAHGRGRKRASPPPSGARAAGDEAPLRFVRAMSRGQMTDLVARFGELVRSNPARARQLLVENPPFGCVIVHALTALGLVDPRAAGELLAPPPPRRQRGAECIIMDE